MEGASGGDGVCRTITKKVITLSLIIFYLIWFVLLTVCIYIFIHTKCSNNKKRNKISNSKDALSVSGALAARQRK